MRHFVIFERSLDHCVMQLINSPSLGEAMATYSLVHTLDVERLEDGSIRSGDSYGGHIIFSHPLAYIESFQKADGWDGNTWEIQEVLDRQLAANAAQIFCSADPDDIKTYIQVCRPFFRAAFPKSWARAFVWPLRKGALVTFHRRKNPTRRWPVEVMARYQMTWNDWEKVELWQGSYDDILEQMLL